MSRLRPMDRPGVLMFMALAWLCADAAAQPRHGDLIVTIGVPNPPSGYTIFVDPTRPGILTTLAAAPANAGHNCVRMAPDNASVVVSEPHAPLWNNGHLVELSPGGTRRTIVSGVDAIDGIALDHDDHWIASSRDFAANPKKNVLLRIPHQSGQPSICASFPSPTVTFNDMAIDRDPGAPVYVVGCWEPTTSTLLSPKILGVDDQGNFSTLFASAGDPLLDLTGIELHPRSGDYLITDGLSPEVNRVGKAANPPRMVATLGNPNAARIGQDDHVWVVGARPFLVLRYDLTNSAVVTLFKLGLPASDWITGIEVYGSRPLVCNQPGTGGSPVTVNVHSQHPQAGGASYVLAASVARRPGLKFANGEWLHLDVSHPLFYTSALGLAPGIFTNFQGQLNAFGSTTATVNIPPGLPPLDDMAIFVAGVIYGGSNIIQVTNTHWFVL